MYKYEEPLTVRELMEKCLLMKGCIGFHPDGSMKNYIRPLENWTVLHSTSHGIYTLGK